jgi:N-acetylmuramoyl-L-alanine amidase
VARGKEVWYPNNIDNQVRCYEAGAALSYCVDRFTDVATNAVDRGCKYKAEERQEFYVIRKTIMPAALIECGFLSNPDEEQLLLQEWYREKLAFGVVMGLCKFAEIA